MITLLNSSQVNEPRKERNPLLSVAIAFLGTLPFDLDDYILQRFLIAFGVLVIVGKLIFLILYVRKSLFAWHTALIVIAGITPISLLMIQFFSKGGKIPNSEAVFQIVVVFGICLYLWHARRRYFRYIRHYYLPPVR
jgi:hypothetical protein